jgi:hypothetical protein
MTFRLRHQKYNTVNKGRSASNMSLLNLFLRKALLLPIIYDSDPDFHLQSL